MQQLRRAQTQRDLTLFCSAHVTCGLTPEVVVSHRADEHLMVVEGNANVKARCSMWWSSTPGIPKARLGLIGHYAADSQSAATFLIANACRRLAVKGCSQAIGPMDGNTWRPYRFITKRGPEPIFFLESDNPGSWPQHFTANGFTPLKSYYAALATDLSCPQPKIQHRNERLMSAEIILRQINLDCFENELRRLYGLCILSFGQNFLFTPICEAEFMRMHLPFKSLIRPELVLIAEADDSPIGLVFGIPNYREADGGQTMDTLIVKSLAVHPAYRGLGLGSVFLARCHSAAKELGFTRAIHAYMTEDNISRRISARYARPIRQYHLFKKDLISNEYC
ncbi:MAG: GNAT family N-acetyltransferase [Desulfobacterales bacterium]